MKKQLVILTAHKPTFKKTILQQFKAPYGVPEYGFYTKQKANSIINEAVSEKYIVIVHHANGNNYLARGHRLINLDKRQSIDLLYNSFVWDKIIIDEPLRTVRIYIDGRDK